MMDFPGIPASLLEEDLRNLRAINRYLGAYRGLLWCLERLIKPMGNNCFTLLDVGTGSGVIAITLAFACKIIGLVITKIGELFEKLSGNGNH